MDCPLTLMTVLPLRGVVSVLVRGRGSLLSLVIVTGAAQIL